MNLFLHHRGLLLFAPDLYVAVVVTRIYHRNTAGGRKTFASTEEGGGGVSFVKIP